MNLTITKTIPVCIDVEVTIEIDERDGTHLDPPECTIDFKYERLKTILDLEKDIQEQVNQLDYD